MLLDRFAFEQHGFSCGDSGEELSNQSSPKGLVVRNGKENGNFYIIIYKV